MQKTILRLLFLLLVLPLGAIAQQGTKAVTLEDIWQRGTFQGAYAGGFNWMANDNYYADIAEDGSLMQFPILTKDAPQPIIPAGAAKDPLTGNAIEIGTYTLSADEKKVLLLTKTTPIYRHSATHVCYVYDRASGATQLVFDGKPVSNPTFSPDGSTLGFTAGNNLYVKNLADSKLIQITSDGADGSIINGSTDWVYEEEFGFPEGFYFSPDGSKVAYYRFDESAVPLFTMDMYGPLYPKRYAFKYPKAGEKNANVQIFVRDLASGTTTEMKVGANPEQYIPAVRWTATGTDVAILRLNRLQNHLEVLLANPATGDTRLLLEEKSDTYIELMSGVTNRLSNLQFLKDGKRFVYLSEKDGYAHLYLYSTDGKLLRQLTQGAWDVTDFYGIDEAKELVYFQSAETSPLQRQVYSVTLDGKKKTLLTPQAGTNTAEFSSGFRFFTHTFSSATKPPVVSLCIADGQVNRVLEDNSKLAAKTAGYRISYKEFFSFKTGEGVELNGWMIKPKDFNESRKYPVLMFVYGGPGSQTVEDSYEGGNFYWYQVLADKGYMIISVDNRGTGARGVAFKKATYQQLGKYETLDQIAAAKYLGSLPYVDAARIGIWGWSYGGYMTLNCLSKGADVFKTGIAVAPVTNWRYYDTIYTERYMRTPQENASGYDDNSPINSTNLFRNKFLLVHGTGDDNVHYQNSIQMVDALVRSNKQFDHFFYPNRNHGIYGGTTRIHLYTMMTNFIVENL